MTVEVCIQSTKSKRVNLDRGKLNVCGLESWYLAKSPKQSADLAADLFLANLMGDKGSQMSFSKSYRLLEVQI